MRKPIMFAAALTAFAIPSAAMAASSSTTNFDAFAPGPGWVNQSDWRCDGCAPSLPGYDESVVSVSPAGQALRISNAVTSGSFEDQMHSPGVDPAKKHFEATFTIRSATGAYQPGMKMSVSPDDGHGGRMSYLRFEDQANGIHAMFDDAIPGQSLVNNPDETGAQRFREKDVATLSRTSTHSVKFVMDLKPSTSADNVTVYIDGSKVVSGSSWKGYYQHDTESGDPHTPPVSNLIFMVRGDGVPANAGKGYQFDDVTLASS